MHKKIVFKYFDSSNLAVNKDQEYFKGGTESSLFRPILSQNSPMMRKKFQSLPFIPQ